MSYPQDPHNYSAANDQTGPIPAVAQHPQAGHGYHYPPPSLAYQQATKREPLLKRRPIATLAALAIGIGAVSGIAGGVAGASLANDGYSVTATGGLNTSDADISSVAATSGTVEAAAQKIGPSVVTVSVTGQQGADTGSGVIIKSEGYIVTNNHVVAAAANGGNVSVTFSDGTKTAAKIVGTDPSSDLAVIKVDKSGLKAAVFANSSDLKVGQSVIAVGAPLGLSNTVTQGIVSTLHRPVTAGQSSGEQSVMDAVQTDAAINPGNSGGPLVDLAGRVVGINSAIASVGDSSSGQAGNIGVGFAIPANDVVRVAGELIADGKASHSQLGVGVSSQASQTTEGATLGQVTSGGPAAAAGLKAGDVITKINDRAITDSDSLVVAIRSFAPGTQVKVTYVRGGQAGSANATLQAAN